MLLKHKGKLSPTLCRSFTKQTGKSEWMINMQKNPIKFVGLWNMPCIRSTFDRIEDFGYRLQWKCVLVKETFVIPEWQTLSQYANHQRIKDVFSCLLALHLEFTVFQRWPGTPECNTSVWLWTVHVCPSEHSENRNAPRNKISRTEKDTSHSQQYKSNSRNHFAYKPIICLARGRNSLGKKKLKIKKLVW